MESLQRYKNIIREQDKQHSDERNDKLIKIALDASIETNEINYKLKQ